MTKKNQSSLCSKAVRSENPSMRASGSFRNFLQVAVVTGRRLPNATKPWRGFMRDGVVESATR